MEQGNMYSGFCICVEAEKLDPFVFGASDEVRYKFETAHPDWQRRHVFEIVGYVGQYIVGGSYPFEFKIIDNGGE
jgi:hypothetical protein